MEKRDYKKLLKEYYEPSDKQIVTVDVPEMNFLMIEGKGMGEDFQNAIEALYTVSYNLKFRIKKGGHEIDYGVMPLEGLWWADDMEAFTSGDKSQWKWRLMIMQPELVSAESVQEAIKEVKEKKNPIAVPLLKFESYHEGLSAHILYVGPFSNEGPVVESVHQYIEDNGYQRRGLHHEIYLSDFRKTDPARLKTIIRQPMK